MANEKHAEAVAAGKKHSFTAIPTNLLFILDCDCYKAIAVLIHEESYWISKGKLPSDRQFTMNIPQISSMLCRSNLTDTRCVLNALKQAELIDYTSTAGKRDFAKFKINWSKIDEIGAIPIVDIIKFGEPIKKLKRAKKKTESVASCCTNCTTPLNKEDFLKKENIIHNDNINKDNNIEEVFDVYDNDYDRIMTMIRDLRTIQVGSLLHKQGDKIIDEINAAASQLGESRSKHLKHKTAEEMERWASSHKIAL